MSDSIGHAIAYAIRHSIAHAIADSTPDCMALKNATPLVPLSLSPLVTWVVAVVIHLSVRTTKGAIDEYEGVLGL